jgi:hypothetical protein
MKEATVRLLTSYRASARSHGCGPVLRAQLLASCSFIGVIGVICGCLPYFAPAG